MRTRNLYFKQRFKEYYQREEKWEKNGRQLERDGGLRDLKIDGVEAFFANRNERKTERNYAEKGQMNEYNLGFKAGMKSKFEQREEEVGIPVDL